MPVQLPTAAWLFAFMPSPLTTDLLDNSGGFNVSRISGVLGLQASEFARLTHRSTEGVAKLLSKESVQPRDFATIQVLKQLVQIVLLLRVMGLSDDEKKRWLRTPLPPLQGKTPSETIVAGRGQELVARLMALASGNVGS